MAAGTVGHPLQRLGAHGAGIVHLPAIEGGGGGGAGAPRVFRASAKSEEAGRPGGATGRGMQGGVESARGIGRRRGDRG